MSVKVFKTNKAGKIEFTRCELEKLLNETYREGYTDGENHAKSNYWTWTSPSVTNTPYYGTVTCDNGSLLRTNTTDGIASTATLCDSTSITSVCDNTVATSAKAPETEKVVPEEAPAKTCESKGMVFDMDEVAKTIDAILNGEYNFASMFANPIGSTNVNGAKKAVEDTPFTNLAKELRSL